MKTIDLTQGQVAIVDDEVFEALMEHGWKWYYHGGYAVVNTASCICNGRRINQKIYMHRWVLESFYNIRVGGCQGDHINGLKTDNRLANLRVATNQQNQFNRNKLSNNTSGYKGVTFDKAVGKYGAWIKHEGKKRFLGYYQNSQEAALVYNVAANEYFGEYACLNKIPEVDIDSAS